MAKSRARSDGMQRRRKVALALQGGGAHGAFTWGVLDRMLEDETIEIIGVTGTSAGAMNAVALADGLLQGGPVHARQKLRDFWEAIGKIPGFGIFLWPLSGEAHANLRLEQTPAYLAWETVSRNLSPYDLNPFSFNPLRAPLTKLIDFDRLRAEKDFQLMVCATNVLSARRRTFTNGDMSVDAVLASACLPQLFPAVMIDGEPYWDGGYTGNPAMLGLIQKLPKCDFIVVRVDPIIRVTLPRSPSEIQDRMREIGFNTAFWLELSAFAVILGFVEQGLLDRERFGRILFHVIEAHDHLEAVPPSSKFNNAPAFLHFLFDLGRKTAEEWFAQYGEAIGQQSTIDLQKLLPVGA